MASLEDLKLPSSNENNAGKATALDHLGLIAGRLRSNALKWNKRNKAGIESKYVLLPIEEVSIMPLFFAEILSMFESWQRHKTYLDWIVWSTLIKN